MRVNTIDTQGEEIEVFYQCDMLELENEYGKVRFIPCATIERVEKDGEVIDIDNFERRHLIEEILEN